MTPTTLTLPKPAGPWFATICAHGHISPPVASPEALARECAECEKG